MSKDLRLWNWQSDWDGVARNVKEMMDIKRKEKEKKKQPKSKKRISIVFNATGSTNNMRIGKWNSNMKVFGDFDKNNFSGL